MTCFIKFYVLVASMKKEIGFGEDMIAGCAQMLRKTEF